MRTNRHSLKTLREIAFAHTRENHPDLAVLARELGGAIHAHAQQLDESLADLRLRRRGFERWLLGRQNHPPMSMLIMAWPPGYSTPSHDHAGLWGLEVSLYGALEVEAWSRADATTPWQMRNRNWLGPGDATWFDADVPYMHRCRNLSKHETALTLHIYGGDLTAYSSYEKASHDESWQAQPQHAVIAGPLLA